MKLVILDRDGVINQDSANFIKIQMSGFRFQAVWKPLPC